MSYIGKSPSIGSYSMLDNLTASATASYSLTLDSVAFVPESANHLLVSLNGHIQKAGSSFTVSSSTLTFSSALTSSDSIDFVLALGSVLDIGTPSDATVTNAKTNFVSTSSAAGLQIKGDGTTDGTLQLNCSQNSHGIKLRSPAHSASASYTLTFPTTDGNADEFLKTDGSGALSWATAGGDNTPAFMAYLSSASSISNTTNTKIVFQTEIFDTDSAYNTSDGLFTVPSGEGGKYFFNFQARPTNWNTSQFQVFILVGGSTYKLLFEDGDAQGDNNTMSGSGIINLSAADTVAVYVYQNGGNGLNLRTGESNTFFSGYKLIGI